MFDLQLRRERIAERMKALQELVPNANKVAENFPHFCSSSFALFYFFAPSLNKVGSFP